MRRRDKGDLKTRQEQGSLLVLIRSVVRRRDQGDLKSRQQQGGLLVHIYISAKSISEVLNGLALKDQRVERS